MNTSPSRMRGAVLAGSATLALAVSALSVVAYSYLKPTAAPSAPVSAIPLASSSPAVYAIQASDSSASFVVDEVLRGTPYTVVGKTDQIAAQIAFDPSNPRAAQLGTILIDARTLKTDDDSRNRALGNRILNTDQYEYISFTPTQLMGLPESTVVGQPFTFQASGELTIKDVTRPAVFDVTVTPADHGSLHGTATATIQYADWGVSIPKVPFVASVANQVVLQLSFRAAAAA